MKVGQKIYYIAFKRGQGYLKDPKEAILTYVGHKFFKTDAEPCSNKLTAQIGEPYSFSDDSKHYFLSIADIDSFFEKIELSKELREYLRYNPIESLSVDKLKAIHKILFDENNAKKKNTF